MKKFLKKYIFEYSLLILTLIFIALCLLPLLKSGYYSDDLINSLYKAKFKFNNINFFLYFPSQILSLLMATGRPNLVSAISGPLLYFLNNNLVFYKIYTLLLILINVGLFWYYLKTITGKKLNFIYLLLLPLLFQFRLYHDPILSFYGMEQFFVIYILVCLIFLEQYLKKNQIRNLLISVFFFNIFLYSYEVAFLFLITIFCTIIFENQNFLKTLKKILPYLICQIIYIGFFYLIKLMSKETLGQSYSGTELNLNFPLILKTFAIQITSAFPLTYFFSKQGFIFCHNISCLISNVKVLDIFLIIIFNLLLYFGYLKEEFTKINIKAILIGITLLVFPAMLVSLTVKYQGELINRGWGIGYLVIYIEYFGMALLLGQLISYIGSIKNNFLNITVFLVLNLILVINLQNNRIIVDKANIDLKYRRQTFEQGFKKGLLKKVPNSSAILIIDNYKYDPYKYNSETKVWAYSYPWKNEFFVYEYSQKRLSVFTKTEDFIKSNKIQKYLLILNSFDEKYKNPNGYLLLGKIKTINNTNSKEKATFSIDSWLIYNPTDIRTTNNY